jgi:hypothetical protein
MQLPNLPKDIESDLMQSDEGMTDILYNRLEHLQRLVDGFQNHYEESCDFKNSRRRFLSKAPASSESFGKYLPVLTARSGNTRTVSRPIRW